MAIKRRDFFKIAGAASLTLLPVKAAAEDGHWQVELDDAYGVLVDTAVCIGCRKCEFACNNENHLGDKSASEFEDRTILDTPRRPTHDAFTVVNAFANEAAPGDKSFIKVQCMHCNRPACVSACIVGALKKCNHGAVTYDAWKCIGCRYCMIACPFQIPAYEYHKSLDPKVRKCTFCHDRIQHGERPACVEICPAEALTFGRRRDLINLAHTKIKTNPDLYSDHVYGEFEIGGTSWLYLTPVDFTLTSLPELGNEPIPENTEKIQHNIFKSFIPPLALYGLLGLIMHAMRNTPDSKEGRK